MTRPVLVAAALALLATAGCIQVGSPPADLADDGLTTLHALVVDDGGDGLSGAEATLTIPGAGSLRKATDRDGNVRFTITPVPACSLVVAHAGYSGGAVGLDCSRDQSFRLALKGLESGSESVPTRAPAFSPGVPAGSPGSFLLQGVVQDAGNGAPLPGVMVRLDAPTGPSQLTGADGAYAFVVLPGDHVITVDGACWAQAAFPVEVQGDMLLDLRLAATTTPPGAPGGVRATPGPGPGMVTVSWNDVPGATGFMLRRSGQDLVRLGHSLAYGVPGAAATDRFAVATLDGCGQTSPSSGEVSADPLPGVPLLAPEPIAVDAEVEVHDYPAATGEGTPLPSRAWRTVKGTGNCCENYLTVTPGGRILDQGGSTLAYSDDAGQTWQGILSPFIVQPGEGSVAVAPDGDILAFDWATYNADTAFSYRYSAATRTWETAPVPKPPFYDRPYLSVVKGPFLVEDMVVPYVAIVRGFSGEMMSLDGLHYVPSDQTLAALGVATGSAIPLRPITTLPDENRDWIGAIGEWPVVPVDNRVGLYYWDAGAEYLLGDDLLWHPAAMEPIPGPLLRVDGLGNLHALALEDTGFTYSWSHDGGETWDSVRQGVGGELWQAEMRANAALDQAIVAVHVAKSDGNDRFAVYRFTGIRGTPVLAEVLEVGLADHPFRGSVAGGGDRFDFMTVGLLPSGKAVLSFGDAEHQPPAIAIEL